MPHLTKQSTEQDTREHEPRLLTTAVIPKPGRTTEQLSVPGWRPISLPSLAKPTEKMLARRLLVKCEEEELLLLVTLRRAGLPRSCSNGSKAGFTGGSRLCEWAGKIQASETSRLECRKGPHCHKYGLYCSWHRSTGNATGPLGRRYYPADTIQPVPLPAFRDGKHISRPSEVS